MTSVEMFADILYFIIYLTYLINYESVRLGGITERSILYIMI